jgi:hypothetical protein
MQPDPQACGWRQALAFYEATLWASSDHLIDHVSTPKVVLEVLEALIAEGKLAPAEGRAIEEQLLSRVTAAGRWVG